MSAIPYFSASLSNVPSARTCCRPSFTLSQSSVFPFESDRIFLRVQVLVEDFVSFSAAFQLIFGNADIHGNRIDGTCLKLYKRIVVIRELLQSGESIGEFFLTAFFLTL